MILLIAKMDDQNLTVAVLVKMEKHTVFIML